MNYMHFLTAATKAAAEEAPQLFFKPANFLGMLKYMGLGMLVIFVVIGIIILVTMLINKFFAD